MRNRAPVQNRPRPTAQSSRRPAYFIADVLKVIEALDKAAEPASETVEVLSLGDGVSAEHVQKTLIKILQQRAAGRPQGEGQRPQPQGEPRRRPKRTKRWARGGDDFFA